MQQMKSKPSNWKGSPVITRKQGGQHKKGPIYDSCQGRCYLCGEKGRGPYSGMQTGKSWLDPPGLDF